MKQSQWFVGVDWASQAHQVCVLDAQGTCRGQRSFPHSGSGLAQMADWILQQTGTSAQAVSVAIEVNHGPVVDFLMERRFAVYAINPTQLDRFRDRFSPAGAKDDRRDARVLADALRTDGHRLRRLKPVASEVIQLRESSRLGEQLTRERTRLLNRLRDQLWRYYPQFLDLSENLAEPWVLQVWKLAPTPDDAQKLRPSRVAKVLKDHRIRRIDAREVLRRLRVPAFPVAAGTTEAAVAHVASLAERLALVQSQLKDTGRQVERLIRAWDQRCESAPGSPGPRRDVAILASLPGVGRIVLATLLSEASDPLRVRGRPRDPALRQTHPCRSPPSRSSSAARGDLPLGPRGRATRPDQPGQVRCPARAGSRPCPGPAIRCGPSAGGGLRHVARPDPVRSESCETAPCRLIPIRAEVHSRLRPCAAAAGARG